MFSNWEYWDPSGTENHKPEQNSLGAGMDQGLNQQQTQEQAETPGVNLPVRQEKSPKWVWDQAQFGREHPKGKRPAGMKTAKPALGFAGVGSLSGLWLWHPHPVSLSGLLLRRE